MFVKIKNKILLINNRPMYKLQCMHYIMTSLHRCFFNLENYQHFQVLIQGARQVGELVHFVRIGKYRVFIDNCERSIIQLT